MEALQFEWYDEEALAALDWIEQEYDGVEMDEGFRPLLFQVLMLHAYSKRTGDWSTWERVSTLIAEAYAKFFPETVRSMN